MDKELGPDLGSSLDSQKEKQFNLKKQESTMSKSFSNSLMML